MGLPQPIPQMSLDEFTEWVLTQDRKYEYDKGEVFDVYAMAGAKANHNLVSINVGAALHSHLKGQLCQAFIADMMVRVEADNVGYYPDVMVTCSPEDRARQSFKTDPLLIVEVLSPSTAAYDRGKKFASYRLLPSLQHVVFIDPEARSIDHFQRDGDRWILLPSAVSTVDFEQIDFKISTADVFDGVTDAVVPATPA
jgi:Uma2 family endonuclease